MDYAQQDYRVRLQSYAALRTETEAGQDAGLLISGITIVDAEPIHKGGRPTNAALGRESRSETVTLRLTPSEKQAIQAQAQTRYLSMEAYLRQAGLSSARPPITMEAMKDLKKLWRDSATLQSNANQMNYGLNSKLFNVIREKDGRNIALLYEEVLKMSALLEALTK